MALTPEQAWSGWSAKEIKKHFVAVYKMSDGTYGALGARGHIPEGAVRLDPQPPRPTSGNPHEGTNIAMAKLESEHPQKINWGCYFAVKIAKKNLTVHSRQVREAMLGQGVIEQNGGPEHWLGAVFKRLAKEGILSKTGHKYKYSDAERGIHEREVTIWGLVENADITKYEKEPT